MHGGTKAFALAGRATPHPHLQDFCWHRDRTVAAAWARPHWQCAALDLALSFRGVVPVASTTMGKRGQPPMLPRHRKLLQLHALSCPPSCICPKAAESVICQPGIQKLPHAGSQLHQTPAALVAASSSLQLVIRLLGCMPQVHNSNSPSSPRSKSSSSAASNAATSSSSNSKSKSSKFSSC